MVNVTHHDILIDGTSPELLKSGAAKLVELIKPQWKKDNFCYKIYNDGLSNRLIGIYCSSIGPNAFDHQVLVRVSGHDLIDRVEEVQNIISLHKADCAPELFCTFTNGIAYGFTPGCPLTKESVRYPQIWRAIVKELCKMHKIPIGNKKCFLWDKQRELLSLIPERLPKPDQHRRFEESGWTLKKLADDITELEQKVPTPKSRLVFTHNDVLLNNIIWNEKTGRAHFIDYEYAGINYEEFEIGNHFNEFAGTDDVDYSLFPEKDFQLEWIRQYLAESRGVAPENVDADELNTYCKTVNRFCLASHLLWGIWSLVQAANSDIDWDYLGYALIRLGEYKRRKDEVLAM